MPSRPNKLFLLDALSLLYRAHFALHKSSHMSTRGIHTGAVLGFANSLVAMLQKEAPTHVLVAFDTPEPTFRHQAFPAYKAHRAAQPEAISIAIPYVKALLQGFGIPVLEKPGYEADDLMGTLACQAAAAGFFVYLMTTDKDLAQLVTDRIYVYKPALLGKKNTIMGVPEVLAHWQLDTIAHIPDLLGLQGDAVDNIPGIPQIGPKTARKLLTTFGSVENLVAQADQLKGQLRACVLAYGQQGILSKQLATIDTQVPINVDLAESRYQGPDPAQLLPLFQELAFRGLANRLFPTQATPATPPTLFDLPAPQVL